MFVLLAEHWLFHTVSLRWIPDDVLLSVQWTCWWKTLTTGVRSVFYCGGKRDCAFTTLSLLKLLAKFNPYKEYFSIKYLLNLRHSLNRKSKYLIVTPVFKKNEFIFCSYHSLGSLWPLLPSALPVGSDRCHCLPNTSSGSSAYSWAWGFCFIWTFSFFMNGSSDFEVHTMAHPELLIRCSRPQLELACRGSS